VARSVQGLRSGAEAALDAGDADEAVKLSRELVEVHPDAEGYFLLGLSLLSAGVADEGEDALLVAVELDEEHADAWLALSDEALMRLDFARALERVQAALRADPTHPGARRQRAALRERSGDEEGALRDYTTAWLADPDNARVPEPLDDATIESVVDEVLAELHPSLREWLRQVPVIVEEVPSVDALLEIEDVHPFELLGSYSGRTISDRGGDAPWSWLPPVITLFRHNLARIAHDRTELLSQLRITLLHEIGHALGLDEHDLAERGLA
jgi:predicted Zn-dependent protease with MMP-like domain